MPGKKFHQSSPVINGGIKKNIFGAGSCAERGRRAAMNAQIRSWGSAIDGTGEYSGV